MRLPVPAIAGLLALTALAGCARHHVEPAVPAGLTYSCSGGPAVVIYDGQGYLPGSTVRTSAASADGEPARVPRSTAQLRYGGRHYRLMADYAETGLRYRSVEPVSDTHALVWAADGETAWIGEVPVAAGAQERRLAECSRDRAVGTEPPSDHPPPGAAQAPHS